MISLLYFVAPLGPVQLLWLEIGAFIDDGFGRWPCRTTRLSVQQMGHVMLGGQTVEGSARIGLGKEYGFKKMFINDDKI